MAAATPPVPPQAPWLFDNASMWYNFTAWTAQHLGYAVNMSRLAPSFEDLVWAGPRMVMKLGRLGSFISFPDAIDGFGQRVIPDPTDANLFHSTLAAMSGAGNAVTSAVPSASSGTAAIEQDPNAIVSRFSLEGAKGLGSVFSYATSRWALCCIAMAVILNRTHVFAATRRRLRLRWQVRLLLRFLPIVLFALQPRRLLQSIQCQTAPDFAELRWRNASKSSDLMFSQQNGFLHGLSSTLNLGASDEDSCLAVHMIPPAGQEFQDLRGSLSLLWPLFGTFCLSQFIETVSCAVQGRGVAAETGMTLFEHSLAFAEADAAISNQLGWGLFSSSTANSTAGLASASASSAGSSIAVTRAMIMSRVNTPPEVLLIAFLSAMSHMTSHVLGILNLQSKFRLINTGFWALCFMGGIIWSAVTFSLEDSSTQGLLRYPTVCIIGVIPHALVLAGIFMCCTIYLLALGLSALAPPDTPGDAGQQQQRPTFLERLRRAHGNMQANVSLSDIRIRMDMDFYTALLRAGFGAITMASEAVYLNEDRRVNLLQHTWLEADRLREVDELRMQWLGAGIAAGARFDPAGTIGLVPISRGGGAAAAASGYARERVAQKLAKAGEEAAAAPASASAGSGEQRRIRDGVGAAERSGRWLMAIEYIMHINRLLLTAWAIAACKFLGMVGLHEPPRWLRWLSRRPKHGEPADKNGRGSGGANGKGAGGGGRRDRDRNAVSEWLPLTDDVGVRIFRHDHVDVEADLRRRLLQSGGSGRTAADESEVDGRLYGWWLGGGWWGNVDMSSDYAPSRHGGGDGDDSDFDATSVITATDAAGSASEAEWVSDDEENGEAATGEGGRRTPTQRSPFPSREATPIMDNPMTMAEMSRLLHPASPDERDEARALAAHLSSEGIVTRSAYRRLQQRRRAEVLASSRGGALAGLAEFAGGGGLSGSNGGGSGGNGGGIPKEEEEEQVLEQVILSRRAAHAVPPAGHASSSSAAAAGSSWATGAAGLGPDGPQCVVCQSAPRTIIVWPCRCLSLCDDCRVSLAMNNFDKCVCCRREVISFSRIYVP